MNILAFFPKDFWYVGLVGRPHHLLRYLSKDHSVTVFEVATPWKDMGAEDKHWMFEGRKLSVAKGYPFRSSNLILNEGLNLIPNVINYLKVFEKTNFDVAINFGQIIYPHLFRVKPMVFDYFDVLVSNVYHYVGNSITRKFLGSIVDSSVRAIVRNSDLVTVNSASLRVQVERIGARHVELIRNGVDTRAFKPSQKERQTIREQFGLTDYFVVGFIGSMKSSLALDQVLRCIPSLKEERVRFLFVGSGYLLRHLRRLSEELRVADRVIFTGQIPLRQVPAYINAMDIGVLPYYLDRVPGECPLTFYQFLSCGKPVISSYFPELVKQFPTEKYSWAMYTSNSAELAERIRFSIHNIDMLKREGRKAREIVRKGYDWDRIGKKLETLLGELAEGKQEKA